MSALPVDDAPRGFVPKADYYRVLAECDRLRDELAEMRERFSSPRYPQDPKQIIALCDALHCKPAQSSTFIRLVDGEVVRRGKNPNATKQHLHYLRIAISGAGGPPRAIRTVRGVGYEITNEGRAWALEALAEPLSARSEP